MHSRCTRALASVWTTIRNWIEFGALRTQGVESTIVPGDQRALAEPATERVLFAGEATEPEHFATVHGAYLSGVREAQRILG